jgi:hypothetical protein
MTTTIHPNGSYLREVYAEKDSAFLAGNKYEEICSFGAPDESIQKHFRWFYTYYSFKTVYPTISAKTPISIDTYLNKSEQKLWFQGDFSAYAGMNGIELKDEMDDIEKRFWEWYTRNHYENYFEAIFDFEKKSENNQYLSKMQTVKDTLFQSLVPLNSIETADIYLGLDSCFTTNYFSALYKKNKQSIDSLIEEKEDYINNLIENLFGKEIDYELIIPGTLLYTNAPINRQDTLIWKVNALRFTADDYELIAESRSIHIWAFVVTFLLLILSIYLFEKRKTFYK